MSDYVDITSGSDAEIEFAFKDGAGVAIEVSSPTIIESTGPLSSVTTANLKDGPNGLVTVLIEGTVPIPVGKYSLRVGVTLTSGNTLGSQRLVINVR